MFENLSANDLAIPDRPNPAAGPAASGGAISRGAISGKAGLAELRERIGRIERSHARETGGRILTLGVPAIDRVLAGGGLALNALHETVSAGADTEHGAAATLFVAGLLARLDGPVLWVLRQADLFAPGLAGVGLLPDRVVFAEAGKQVLAVMEEGLRHRGLTAVVAELTGKLSLVASRRLQLAAEQGGVMAILIRRSPTFDNPVLREPSAATTRWRIGALPGACLSRARWRVELTRCRGAEAGSWVVEACDATGRLGVAADAGDRSVAAA